MNAMLVESDVKLSMVTEPVSTFITSKDIVPEIAHFSPVLAEEKEQVNLLLIEDNTELAEIITTSLPNYKVSRVTDKTVGLKNIVTLMPDLVMINVDASAMSGYDWCKKIKEDERTNHIPVVLILGNVSDSLTAELASDADEYLVKPFSKEELCLRVKKLIVRQVGLRKALHKELYSPATIETKINSPSDLINKDLFLEKIYAVIEKNLDNINFDVAALAKQLFISKANLYRKLKAISCPAPVYIINHYRLQRAAQYLIEGISCYETADKTGFNSAAYFSNCFRKLYKVRPHEFCRLQTEK